MSDPAREHQYPADPGCIFCKIVAGDIPCHKLYETNLTLSFLDVGPLSKGHALIIPKGHWATVDQLPDEVAAACMHVAPRLCRAISQAVNADAWNILQNNGRAAHQAVDHVHFHIIPKFVDSGLGIDWSAGELDAAEAKSLIEAIGENL